MKIKIYLTKGEPITVSEEQAMDILKSNETLYALKDKHGKWNGDVIHKSHIVQMLRDYEEEKEELLKNPRLENKERMMTPAEHEALMTSMKNAKPKVISYPHQSTNTERQYGKMPL